MRGVLSRVALGALVVWCSASCNVLSRLDSELAHPPYPLLTRPSASYARVTPWRPPFRNASFESVMLGWRLDGQAMPSSMRHTLARSDGAAKEVLPERIFHRSFGGDYWQTPVKVVTDSIRQEGDSWLEANATAHGTVTSPALDVAPGEHFVSVLARFARTGKVELVDRTGTVVAKKEDIEPSGLMVPVIIKVPSEPREGLHFRVDLEAGDAVDSFLVWRDEPDPNKDFDAVSDRGRALSGVWGFADLHAHLFNQIGFGGRTISGAIHSSLGATGLDPAKKDKPSDIAAALPPCHADHGRDATGLRANGSLGLEGSHDAGGYPDFNGWPRYWTLQHQQAYVDWLKRAHDGGLRLVNVDVGNSQIVAAETGFFGSARNAGHLNPTDDAWSIERELQAIHDFVALPDVRPWVAIATSPDDARRIVASGKLAFVLGVETDDVGNYSDALVRVTSAEAQARVVDAYLDWLYAHDVRHVFPVHMIENAFGAPAAYDFETSLDNYFSAYEREFQLRNAFSDGIRFRMDLAEKDEVGSFLTKLLGFVEHDLANEARARHLAGKCPDDWNYLCERVDPPKHVPIGHAHARGLTEAGKAFIRGAMKRGMIIDLDHMSDLATRDTLAIVKPEHYPVMSSHTAFRELSFGSWKLDRNKNWVRNFDTPLTGDVDRDKVLGAFKSTLMAKERDRSTETLADIVALGGMMGLGVGPGSIPHAVDSRVPDLCDGSATTFAQEYLFAVAHMGGRGIALGTDINGFNGMANPRFGLSACKATYDDAIRGKERQHQIDIQENAVLYKDDGTFDPITLKHRLLRMVGEERLEGKPGDPNSVFDDNDIKAWEGIIRFENGFYQRPGQQGLEEVLESVDLDTHFRDEVSIAWGLYLGFLHRKALVKGDKHYNAAWAFSAHPEWCNTRHPDVEDQAMFASLCKMSTYWQRLRAGRNEPLSKSYAGHADFDINIDGLAHYGLLPDYLQDVVNVGVPREAMGPLFRGAEDYIEMWDVIDAYAATHSP